MAKTKKRLTKKERLINRIREIIKQDGAFSMADVEAQSSPVHKTIGKNTSALVERCRLNDVDIQIYVHETATEEDEVEYKDLDIDTLEEILILAEDWSAISYKTMKRASN